MNYINTRTDKKFKKVITLFGKEIEIPEEWEMRPIFKILDITMGQSPPYHSYNKDHNGLPFYQGVTDFGIMFPNPTVWCTDPKKITTKNSILFSVRAPVGELNIANSKCCLGRGIASLRPQKNNLLYCFYIINKNKKKFLTYSQGTTYDAINKDEIANIKLVFTNNIVEQQKIASILSRVDALIETTQECIEKTQKLKNGLLQTLFKKGVNHKKFKKVKTMFGKYELIPEEWTINKLDKISKKIIDGTHFTPNYINKGIPFLRVVDIQKFPLNWNTIKKISYQEHHELIKRCKPEKNDILYSKNGTIGIPRLVDWNEEFSCFVSLCLIKLKQNVMHSDFLVYFLLTNFIKKQISSKTKQLGVANLHLEEIREFRILTPPLIEQQKIASILSEVDAFDKYVNQIIHIFMLKNLLLNYGIIQQTKLSIFINVYAKILILYKNNIG